MKRNDEDRLIELAFEDISAEEAAVLRNELENDPSQAGKLRAYAEMRDGLASLRDVPEMQMSCDRLRDAILAGGLKEPRGGIWAWLAVPVAVAAGAFLFTMVTKRTQVALPNIPVAVTSLTGPTYDVAMDRTAKSGLESIRIESAITPLGNTEFKIALEPDVLKSAPKRSNSRVANRTSKESNPTIENVVAPPAPAGSEPAKMSLTAEGPAFEKEDKPLTASLIVITSDENGDTGTQRATEVESVSNVVIGG